MPAASFARSLPLPWPKGLADQSVLRDVRKFADRTKNDKLRTHASDLIRSLEEEGEAD